MPRFNPWAPERYAAGIGGEGAVISLNRHQILPQPGQTFSASGHDWFAADAIGATVWPLDGQMAVCEVALDGTIRQVLWKAAQISYSTFGGGHWAATTWEGGQPRVIVDGVDAPGLAPICFGPDGTLAWFPWGGQGLRLRGPQGAEMFLSANRCDDVQVFGYGHVIWREGWTVRTFGMIDFPERIELAAGSCWVRGFYVNGRAWLTYQTSSEDNVAPVVAHPAWDLSQGWIVKAQGDGQAKRLDAAQHGDVVFAWDSSDGDQPANLREVTIPASQQLVPLHPPPPPPPDDPEPPMPEPPSQKQLLDTLWTKYGGAPGGGNPIRGAILNEAAWIANGNQADGPWGLSKKNGGVEQPTTGVTVAHDILHYDDSGQARFDGRIGLLYDCFSDTAVRWAKAAPHNRQDRVWVPAVRPEGVPEPPPDPPEPPEPPQPPDPISEEIRKLQIALGNLQTQVRVIDHDLDLLGVRVETLENAPIPIPPAPELPELETTEAGPWYLKHRHGVVRKT